MSNATTEDVTVALGTSGTGTEGTDYANISDITISAGGTTGTATFDPTDDSVYEGNETAIVAITGVSGGSATENGTQSETITITENEAAPTVTLSTSGSIAENSGSSLTLTATLSTATTADVTVTFSTGGGATEGTDYQTLSNITISAGATTGTTSFTPIDDSLYEGNELAQISIDTVSGGSATENGTQSVTLEIVENESAPTVNLSVSSSTVTEGSSLTITATMSKVSHEDVFISLSGIQTGTATAGTDYTTLANARITISAGNTTGTTTFTTLVDNKNEGNETYGTEIQSISLHAVENGTQTISVTIVDDESLSPTITLSTSASSIAENSDGTITITATMSAADGDDVTVVIGTSGTGTEGTDYANISDITISAGDTTGTATFDPTDDSVYEGNETAIVAITGVTSSGSATESGTQSETITITEDDAGPTVTLSTSASSIAENSLSTLTLTATLSNATTEDVTVALGTSGTGTEGTDYANISDITISAGGTTGTATFDPTDDSVYEGNETAIVAITGVSGGSATENGTQSETITITENEGCSYSYTIDRQSR